MTRFSITMDEALDFILDSTKIGIGSEIFVPKLRAYSIIDIKNALTEILGKTKEEQIGIRAGEKLHETLINHDEMRDVYDLGDKYVIINPSNTKNIKKYSTKMKKNDLMNSYSSDKVEKIPNDELKKLIANAGLLK